MLVLSAFLTAFYMWRQITLVFFGTSRTRAAGTAAENSPLVTGPLVVLALLAVLGGALNLPGIYTLEHWLEHTIEGLHAAEFNIVLAIIATLVALTGLLLAYLIYGRKPATRSTSVDPLETRMSGLFNALSKRWWVDEIYHTLFVRSFQAIAGFLARPIDQDLIDGIANGFGVLTQSTAQVVRKLQNGFVRSYALMVLFGVVAILTFLLWRMP
jgi:NADH-quinone oxidoreductase subunit L